MKREMTSHESIQDWSNPNQVLTSLSYNTQYNVCGHLVAYLIDVARMFISLPSQVKLTRYNISYDPFRCPS